MKSNFTMVYSNIIESYFESSELNGIIYNLNHLSQRESFTPPQNIILFKITLNSNTHFSYSNLRKRVGKRDYNAARHGTFLKSPAALVLISFISIILLMHSYIILINSSI